MTLSIGASTSANPLTRCNRRCQQLLPSRHALPHTPKATALHRLYHTPHTTGTPKQPHATRQPPPKDLHMHDPITAQARTHAHLTSPHSTGTQPPLPSGHVAHTHPRVAAAWASGGREGAGEARRPQRHATQRQQGGRVGPQEVGERCGGLARCGGGARVQKSIGDACVGASRVRSRMRSIGTGEEVRSRGQSVGSLTRSDRAVCMSPDPTVPMSTCGPVDP